MWFRGGMWREKVFWVIEKILGLHMWENREWKIFDKLNEEEN